MLILGALLLQLVLTRSITGQQQNVPAQSGGSVTITKGEFSETENVFVRWYFSPTGDNYVLLIWRKQNDSPKPGDTQESKDWQNRVSLSENSDLIISSVLESDFAGVFKCEQSNYRKSIETQYKLKNVTIPMNLLLLAGDELSLDCSTQLKVRWIAPNSSTYANRQFGNTYKLRVPNTSVQDSGVWVCEMTSPSRKFRATTAVTVLGLSPPPSETVYTSTSALSTSSTTLPCSLSADVPWAKLREKGLQGGSWKSSQGAHSLLTLELNNTQAWTSQDTTSCLTGKVLKNHDLSVQSSVLTDCRGTYQCSLEFKSRRTMSTTVKLEVLEVLSSTPAGVKLLEGAAVNLNCSLGVPLPPDLQVKWIRPKSSAFSLPEPQGDNLFLPVVSIKDSGQWKCELRKNSKVLTSASVTLKIEKRVDTWVVVTIGSASVFILLLIITLIIIHRRRQVIITRRKTRFCCCKNPQPKGFYKS